VALGLADGAGLPWALLVARSVVGLSAIPLWDEPIWVLLTAIMHFIADDEDPWAMLALLMSALAPGSYLALCHGTADGLPPEMAAVGVTPLATKSGRPHLRRKNAVTALFAGLEIVSAAEGGLAEVCPPGPVAPADGPGHCPALSSAWRRRIRLGTPPDLRRAHQARRDSLAVHGVADPACCGHRSGTTLLGPANPAWVLSLLKLVKVGRLLPRRSRPPPSTT
jgi:hypothetical protein